MTQLQRMDSDERGRILVSELNPVITCRLCEGYLIDATTLIDCLHCFCRACILRYFENSKIGCPICNTVYKKKSQFCFRSDPQIQSIVYKLVPSLYSKEIQRREDFYRSTGVRASSSCSDDSVIDRERDMINEQEKMISKCVGVRNQFLGQDDPISLSLEYYQVHLDTTDDNEKPTPLLQTLKTNSESGETKQVGNSENVNSDKAACEQTSSDSADLNSETKSEQCKDNNADKNVKSVKGDDSQKDGKESNDCDKRYLQCPAAVSMKHLQKFIRMKFGLTGDHRVDIIYKGEVLPSDYSLIDVAYIFKWKRLKPMRFFYRIFTPMKVRPIKIINATLSTGGKQLQIVPVKSISEPIRQNEPEKPKQETPESKPDVQQSSLDQSEDQKKELFAHLQLQSKSQVEKDKQSVTEVPEKSQPKDCIFEYEEPEEEFAEKRDREWALQKKLDEEQYSTHHFTKKRKKNKHSKNEFNVHKKRKLHAEIASNDAELKLKVKITNNGHKHKHHKSSGQVSDKTANSEASKEKLLQMRQIRHKHVSSEDKTIQTVPSIKLTATTDTKGNSTEKDGENNDGPKRYVAKPVDDIKKLKIKVSEPSSKVSESAVLPKQQDESINTSPKVGTFPEASNSKTSFKSKPSAKEEWGEKQPAVHIERSEQTDKQVQKAFLKPLPANAEKSQKVERAQQTKIVDTEIKPINNVNKMHFKNDIRIDNNKIKTNNKFLDRQIATLQQHCTIKPKKPENAEKRVSVTNEKPKFFTPHYPPGFTVSKVEQGVKRKIEEEDSMNDKRPSLEITLINPPSSPSTTIQNSKPLDKPLVKRPPPATIPLEKIKKSVHLKSAGISIIPKMPNEKCDNIGALDLSKPSTKPTDITAKSPSTPNGYSIPTNRQLNALSKPAASSPNEKNNTGLSNLHMLSKVATEHSSFNKSPSPNNPSMAKPRPQMPSLQTIKIPAPQNQTNNKLPNANLQKMPKLNEIAKFRPHMPIRSVRPNQNQNIRNIPNPSLLIRQQNQNRLNSQMNSQQMNATDSSSKTTVVGSAVAPTVPKEASTTITALKVIDSKVQEKKEISV